MIVKKEVGSRFNFRKK